MQSAGFGDRQNRFQSTPPVKAATDMLNSAAVDWAISIHAAREGGDVIYGFTQNGETISIHAAREGGDGGFLLLFTAAFLFQSTPPVKAATTLVEYRRGMAAISIHAAREGGDLHSPHLTKKIKNFNPRRP